jgi:hypothetical protein
MSDFHFVLCWFLAALKILLHSGLHVLATPLPDGRTGLIWRQMMHSAILGSRVLY